MPPLRRLLLLVGAIVLVDTMFYEAIVPLLPGFREDFGLTKTGAGVLAGAYAAGTLVGALPAGWLAAHWGVRQTVLVGLGLMSLASLAFGLANDIVVLDLARFAQGVGGAASWAGGLAWLVRVAPPERRGEMIGSAWGAAIGGALLGPVLGAIATSVGVTATFTAVALVGVLLALVAAREPAPPPLEEEATLDGLGRAMRSGAVRAGAALIIFIGLYYGVAEVLIPLRLDHLGASAAAIGATWVAAAGVETLTSRPVGLWSDRVGPILPARLALGSALVFAVLLPLPEAVWLLAVISVIGFPTIGAVWVPGMSMVSEGSESAGLDQAYAFAVINLVWAGSQLIGSTGGGALADATSDLTVYAILAAVSAVGLALTIGRRWQTREPGSSPAPPTTTQPQRSTSSP